MANSYPGLRRVTSAPRGTPRPRSFPRRALPRAVGRAVPSRPVAPRAPGLSVARPVVGRQAMGALPPAVRPAFERVLAPATAGALSGAALRLGFRLVPWLGLAVSLAELADWYASRYYAAGWTLTLDCGRRVDAWAPSNVLCGVTLAFANGVIPPINAGTSAMMSMEFRDIIGTTRRYRPAQNYQRGAAVTPGFPQYVPKRWPLGAVPFPWPQVIPDAQPVVAPQPHPLPIPYPLIPLLPEADPAGNPLRGPRPRVRPRVRPRPGTPTVPGRVVDGVVPVRPPSPRPGPRPAEQPVVWTPPSGDAPREPPGPRVKERKQVIAIGGTPARIVNAVGEIPDFVEAFHDALPPRYQAHRAGTIHQARALYDHWDKVDMEQAILNLILNQIEDYAYGRLGRINAAAARAAGRNTGFQLGPWDTALLGFPR